MAEENSIFYHLFRESQGYQNYDYGYSKQLKPGLLLRLVVSDGWIYPQIEQSESMEETQIIGLKRIKYQNELIELEQTLIKII